MTCPNCDLEFSSCECDEQPKVTFADFARTKYPESWGDLTEVINSGVDLREE